MNQKQGHDDAGSAPCAMHELAPDGTLSTDPQQSRDVGCWRKAERERLIAVRLALSIEYRTSQTALIARELDAKIPQATATIVSAYWPIRAEPDLRAWMRRQWDLGIRIALPVAVALGQPLKFREWRPDGPMIRGLWNIPYPANGLEVVPTVILAPLVGFDALGYRLGFGGGFFDRTLAQITGNPLVIGVGYPYASIATIYPQPHDIAMNCIISGENSR